MTTNGVGAGTPSYFAVNNCTGVEPSLREYAIVSSSDDAHFDGTKVCCILAVVLIFLSPMNTGCVRRRALGPLDQHLGTALSELGLGHGEVFAGICCFCVK